MVFGNLIRNYQKTVASATFREAEIIPMLHDLDRTFRKGSERASEKKTPPKGVSEKSVSFSLPAHTDAKTQQLKSNLAYLSEVQSHAKSFTTYNRFALAYNAGAIVMNAAFIGASHGGLAPISGPAIALHTSAAALHYRWQKQGAKTWKAIRNGLKNADGVAGLDLHKLSFMNDKLSGLRGSAQLARDKAVTEVLGESNIDREAVEAKVDAKKMSRDRLAYKFAKTGLAMRTVVSRNARAQWRANKVEASEAGLSRYACWVERRSNILVDNAEAAYKKRFPQFAAEEFID